MVYITNGAVPVKPTLVRASIDTIELFCRIPPKGLRTRIEAVVGRRIKIAPVIIKKGGQEFHVGDRAIVNQPTLEVLPVLSKLLRYHRGVSMHQVDIAFDFHYRNEDEADHGDDQLCQHLVLKHRSRRAGKVFYDNQESMYWCRGAKKGKRRFARELLVYRKARKVVRIELRFQNAGAVRRAGLADPEKLASINPAEIFERNLRLITMKESYIEKTVRRAVKKDRERHLRSRATIRTGSKFDYDRYRAGLADRVKGVLLDSDMQGFISGMKRSDRAVRKLDVNWVGTELDWRRGLLISLDNFGEGGVSIDHLRKGAHTARPQQVA